MKRIFGGSWLDEPRAVWGAYSIRSTPGFRYHYQSLRLARSPMQQAQKGVKDE